MTIAGASLCQLALDLCSEPHEGVHKVLLPDLGHGDRQFRQFRAIAACWRVCHMQHGGGMLGRRLGASM